MTDSQLPAKQQTQTSAHSATEDELAGTEQTFISHLVELRDRLTKALIAIAVAAIVLAIYPGASNLYDWLAAPLVQYLPKGTTLIATSVISPFIVPLKILFVSALLVALPVVLYQIWAFVAPGLYMHEKRLVLPLVISSTILFFIGVFFCYFIVFGKIFSFIQQFAPKTITAAPDIEQYLSFVLGMFLAFGLAFEVPIAVIVSVRIGMVSPAQLRNYRGYFLVGAAIVTAIVTPPDAASMLMLLGVIAVLYEVGIVCSELFVKYTQAPKKE